MIDASKFAKPVGNPQKFKDGRLLSFSFGSNTREEIAAEIRKFADAVEEGSVLIQKVQSGAVVCVDEYLTLGLYFEFNPMIEVEGKSRIAEPNQRERIIDLVTLP